MLQAIDAAGKDGTIKHVMSGLNPEGVDVYSFKAPSDAERAHDYLWRHQLAVPELGRIAVFNRSHYENVTVTRVHPELLWPRSADLTSKHIWHRRYRQINDWERYLTENGTVIIKLFLHLSRDEQKRRFLQRIDDETKNWKVSSSDMREREYWSDYQEAFSDMLTHTSGFIARDDLVVVKKLSSRDSHTCDPSGIGVGEVRRTYEGESPAVTSKNRDQYRDEQ